MKNNPCQNCTVGEWGGCYTPEYGECMHHKNREKYMKKQFTRTELEALDFFQLIHVAEYWQVENYEHFAQPDLIEAILNEQITEPEKMEVL